MERCTFLVEGCSSIERTVCHLYFSIFLYYYSIQLDCAGTICAIFPRNRIKLLAARLIIALQCRRIEQSIKMLICCLALKFTSNLVSFLDRQVCTRSVLALPFNFWLPTYVSILGDRTRTHCFSFAVLDLFGWFMSMTAHHRITLNY